MYGVLVQVVYERERDVEEEKDTRTPTKEMCVVRGRTRDGAVVLVVVG